MLDWGMNLDDLMAVGGISKLCSLSHTEHGLCPGPRSVGNVEFEAQPKTDLIKHNRAESVDATFSL